MGGCWSMPSGLEADGIDRTVDFGYADDGFYLICRLTTRYIDRFATESSSLGEPLRVHVGDDNDGRTKKLSRVRSCESNRTRAGHVDSRARFHARTVGTVEAGGKDVGQHGEITQFGRSLVRVGKGEQVPVRVRHQHVLRLPADPAAHVDVPIRRSRSIRVDV